jgi:hypothetical protein
MSMVMAVFIISLLTSIIPTSLLSGLGVVAVGGMSLRFCLKIKLQNQCRDFVQYGYIDKDKIYLTVKATGIFKIFILKSLNREFWE